MTFPRPTPLRLLFAVLSLGAGPALAQESGVYISQVDQSATLTNSRRAALQDTTARVLSNASVPAGTTPTATSRSLSFDLTTPNGVANAVNAAGLAGGGAGTLANSVAIINQYGSNNVAGITQTGGGNNSQIDQYGINGRATANITGSGNTTQQMQLGLGANTSAIGINGSNNAISTGQLGIGNTTTINVTGNGYAVSSQQSGIGLNYSFDSTKVDGGAKSISINQIGIGSGMSTPVGALPTGVAPIIQTVR